MDTFNCRPQLIDKNATILSEFNILLAIFCAASGHRVRDRQEHNIVHRISITDEAMLACKYDE